MLGAYRVAPDIFRITDPQVRETVKSLFTDIGCKCEEHQEFLKVVCG